MLFKSKSQRNISPGLKIQISLIPSKIILSIVFFIIFPVCTSTTLYHIFSSLSHIDLPSNPTSIPWINNKSDCLHTYRAWKDNKCSDSEHSSTF